MEAASDAWPTAIAKFVFSKGCQDRQVARRDDVRQGDNQKFVDDNGRSPKLPAWTRSFTAVDQEGVYRLYPLPRTVWINGVA